jgi:glycosyltransferase involved in cell wall biosynthesis
VQSHDKFGIRPYFYIDGTLEEYFQNYMQYETSIVDKGAMASAMAAERDGYAACLKVIVMSRRTAELLTQNYSVPRTKIYIVPPGANIPEDRLEQFDQNSSSRLRRTGHPRSLTLGFIGLYPERKGLPTIAAAVGLLRRAGYDVRLHVIGKCPASIAEQDGVTYFGIIHKRTGLDRLIDIVSKIDLGCMLSRAELTGIALSEFLRLGIPIIATDVGGIPDILELGAGELVSSASSEEYLASLLSGLIDEPERLQALKETAWQRRYNASWRRVVRELGKVVQS